jgi:enhancing lycopene biosynthesis protein 2
VARGRQTENLSLRKVLVESARIARGAISPLSQLIVGHFLAVVLPGGFGAAKNLSSYAVEGEEMEVETEAKRVLEQFRAAGKPIGLCCISPVLAARLFPGVAVTVGDDTDPAACAVRGMGASHVPRPVTEVCLDSERLVVTTPAYMYEAPLHQIFDGVREMISTVLRLVK